MVPQSPAGSSSSSLKWIIDSLKCIVYSLKCIIDIFKCIIDTLKCIIDRLKCIIDSWNCIIGSLKCIIDRLKWIINRLKCIIDTLKCIIDRLKCKIDRFKCIIGRMNCIIGSLKCIIDISKFRNWKKNYVAIIRFRIIWLFKSTARNQLQVFPASLRCGTVTGSNPARYIDLLNYHLCHSSTQPMQTKSSMTLIRDYEFLEKLIIL